MAWRPPLLVSPAITYAPVSYTHLPQSLLQFVESGGAERRLDCAEHGVGHTGERAVNLIDCVVEKIQRLDAGQLQTDILVKVEIHLAG